MQRLQFQLKFQRIVQYNRKYWNYRNHRNHDGNHGQQRRGNAIQLCRGIDVSQ